MDDPRETIARAVAGADSGTLHGVKPCAACQIGDTNQPCDDCLIMADAVIAALGLREERRPGATTMLNDSVWTRPDKRRYITDWGETP